jgi:acyl-homoserine lactone acylase PvdQ
MSKNDSTKDRLTEVVNLLKSWDRNSASASVATTVAIEWAYKLAPYITPPAAGQASNLVGQLDQMASLSSDLKLKLLSETLQILQAKFGSWKTSWGEVNRYQRIGANEKFNDQEKSFPVGLAAAKWGSIPSYVSAYYPNTNKRYGVSGNSFIACVEFGKRLKAKTIITGGQSFDPRSNHYTDQAKGYINGDFKDVWFYKEDVLKHIEKTYHPGDEH